jgi:multidrug resistance efflux pump
MDAALAEMDAALAEMDAALVEMDAALAEMDAALAEMDAALAGSGAGRSSAHGTGARLSDGAAETSSRHTKRRSERRVVGQ